MQKASSSVSKSVEVVESFAASLRRVKVRRGGNVEATRFVAGEDDDSVNRRENYNVTNQLPLIAAVLSSDEVVA